MKKTISFWGVVKDLDNKKVAIIGPLSDDTELTNKVAAEIQKGKNLNIQAISDMTPEEIQEYWKERGYSPADEDDILR